MIGDQTIKFNLTLNWLIGVVLIAVILIGAFWLGKESWQPSLIFTASVLGVTAALVAAAHAIETRIEQVQQTKKAAALDFIIRWNNPPFSYAKTKWRGRHQVTKKGNGFV